MVVRNVVEELLEMVVINDDEELVKTVARNGGEKW